MPRSDRAKGGRPRFDCAGVRDIILQAIHDLLDERTEYMTHCRLSFMRFLGLGLVADTVPDTNTIWTFRETLHGGSPASRQSRFYSSASMRRSWHRC